MQKEKLIKTINRYFLNNSVPQAVLKVENNTLTSKFLDNNQLCVGYIKVDDFQLNDCELGVGNTTSLLNILKPFSDEIKMKVDNDEEIGSIKLLMSDGNFNSRYYLFSPKSIPQVSIEESGLGDIILEFKLNSDFFTNFKKAKESISDSNHFAIVSDEKSTRCIINYNTNTSNHILFKFEPDNKNSNDIKLVFDSNLFLNIINNNSDYTECNIIIYNNCQNINDLMIIDIKGADYESKYYLIPKIINN